MKRKHDTRDVPPEAKKRVSKGVQQAMLTVFGKDVWCDLTSTGRAKVVRPEWYASLRMVALQNYWKKAFQFYLSNAWEAGKLCEYCLSTMPT